MKNREICKIESTLSALEGKIQDVRQQIHHAQAQQEHRLSEMFSAVFGVLRQSFAGLRDVVKSGKDAFANAQGEIKEKPWTSLGKAALCSFAAGFVLSLLRRGMGGRK